MNGRPASTHPVPSGNVSDTARTMNTSGSSTLGGLTRRCSYSAILSSNNLRVITMPASLEHKCSVLRS
jgi:hypothetical protein